MTKTTKTLLILVFYVALPLGAIFLGLFLISRLLEKETALYDAEQRNVLVALKAPAEQQASASPTAARPTLAKAH